MQPKQPEHPPGRLTQVQIRPGERGAYAAGDIAGIECVQPSLRVSQLIRQRSERDRGQGRGAGSHHAERQRQQRTHLDQLGGGLGLGHDPLVGKTAGQQLTPLAGGEQAEGELVRPIGCGQPGELPAAGHND